MNPTEAKAALGQLCTQANAVADTAKTAQRGGKSLRGDNFYGHKFHDGVAAMSGTLARLKPTFLRLTDEHLKTACEVVTRAVETLKSFDADGTTRMKACKQIALACEEMLYPALDTLDAPAMPASEQVLPMAVVRGTRGYIVNVVLQANGNYERGWFDACSVMIRKLVEILIIEVYEKAGRAAYIKVGGKAENDFLMLSDLVDRILGDTAFNLARECKKTLPLVKALGDRSAHNRRYMATRPDVDNIIPGLRVVADDLLHLAGLK
jgi:hypothetical protein